MRRRGRPPVTPLTDMGRLIRTARIARGWTQADLALQIGCSIPAVAGWESGRRLRVDPVYALSMSRVMPELNYMDLVQKSERHCERPGKPKLDHVREKLVSLPRGLLTAARAVVNRHASAGRAEAVMAELAPKEIGDQRPPGEVEKYLAQALISEKARRVPRPEVVEFLEDEGRHARQAVDEPLDLIREGDNESARELLLAEIEKIYEDALPRRRWLLAHALLALGDVDGAFANLRRASGTFAPGVRALLESLRTSSG